MIKFIIVDDDIKFQNNLKELIRRTTFNNEERTEISCFNTYNSDLQHLINDNSQRKVYLLDIDLQCEITGINIALKIREKDWDSEIIFLTYHNGFFEKVCSISFLIKSISIFSSFNKIAFLFESYFILQ